MEIKPNRGWEGLPQISKYMYQDTYFLKGEDYNGWVDRMTTAYCKKPGQAERVSAMFKNYWFHGSTPVSSNGGTNRGYPISCYVGDVPDSKEGIFGAWEESCWLGSGAGGIGRDWSQVREMGADINGIGKSSGIIPFMCVDGALTRAVSQGGTRRMSQADYLSVSHPEIVEFLDIRKSTGDQNRRDQDLHHGVSIPNAFMEAVINGTPWDLISPKTNKVVDTVDARKIWTHILEMRVTTGEPYLFFYDNVNTLAPEEYKRLGLDIHLSNLCTEIMLNTSSTKTNVCCLASLNLEYWDEMLAYGIDQVIEDASDFLDNVLQDFIDKTEGKPGFEKARNAAIEERALGLGVMGFHSLLQKKHIPFESALAQGLNMSIFRTMQDSSDRYQATLDPCPMSVQAGTNRRNIVVFAIAPTMSISNLCNLASSGIEPWASNAFSKKLKQGTFAIQNKFLDAIIRDYAINNNLSSDWYDEQWTSIKKHEGSVQHLDWLDDYAKDVFKTAFEIDQRWVIQHAADRTEYVDQGQSLNIFVEGNSHVQYLSDLHVYAWRKGIKSMYYMRSRNPNRATSSSKERQTITNNSGTNAFDDGCLGCQ